MNEYLLLICLGVIIGLLAVLVFKANEIIHQQKLTKIDRKVIIDKLIAVEQQNNDLLDILYVFYNYFMDLGDDYNDELQN